MLGRQRPLRGRPRLRVLETRLPSEKHGMRFRCVLADQAVGGVDFGLPVVITAGGTHPNMGSEHG